MPRLSRLPFRVAESVVTLVAALVVTDGGVAEVVKVPILTVGCAISHSLGSEVVCGTMREAAEVVGKGAGGCEISRGSLAAVACSKPPLEGYQDPWCSAQAIQVAVQGS